MAHTMLKSSVKGLPCQGLAFFLLQVVYSESNKMTSEKIILIGKEIRRRREAAKMTLRECGERAGLSGALWHKYETGKVPGAKLVIIELMLNVLPKEPGEHYPERRKSPLCL